MKMDKRETIILILTICAFAFLGWQVYDMIWGGPKPVTRTQPVAQQASTTDKPAAKQAKEPAPEAKTTPNTAAMQNKPVTESNQYLSMVDRLELYKMQSQVLQQQLAIAKTKQEIAKLSGGNSNVVSEPVATAVNQEGSDLRLSYLAEQQGVWQAIIAINGQYQTVVKGDHLADGSEVVAISRAGVTLAKDSKQRVLTF